MNRSLPILIAAILAISTFATVQTQSAQAQLAQARVSMYVTFIDLNGNRSAYPVGTNANPFALIDSRTSSQLNSIEIAIKAVTTSSADKITSANYINPVVKVLKRDGSYASVSQTDVSRIVTQAGPIVWQLYKAKVSPAEIESILGTGPEFKSEIRVTSTTVNFQGTIAARTGTFYATSMNVALPVTKTVGTGVTYNPPSTTTSSSSSTTSPSSLQQGETEAPVITNPVTDTQPEVKPTGKMQSIVRFMHTNGLESVIVSDATPFKTFSLTSSDDPSHTDIKSITYQLNMIVDNDVFATRPVTLQYADQMATSNYNALINNVQIGKVADTTVQKIGGSSQEGWGQYQLLKMTVTADNLTPQLKPVADDNPKLDFTSGTLAFYNAGSSLDLVGGGKTYHLTIPEQRFAVDLGSQTAVSQSGACEISGESCTPTNGAMSNNVLILILGAVAAVGVVAVAAKRRVIRR